MGAIYRQNLTAFLQTLVFAAFLLCAPSLANAQDVTTGLVGHWRLDETAGTTAADSSGNGNNATLTNADFGTDSINAIIRTGYSSTTNDNTLIVQSADFPSGVNQPFTYSAWLQSDPTGPEQYIMGYGGNGGTDVYLRKWGASMRFFDGTAFVTANLGNVNMNYMIPDNEWFHLTAVYDGTDILMYKDGVYIDSFFGASFTINASPFLAIGSNIGGIFEWYGGRDDVRIYNRALSAADIAVLASSFPGPVTCNAAYEAVMWFNQDESVMQYCDGTNWIDMGYENSGCPSGGALVGGSCWYYSGTDGDSCTDVCTANSLNYNATTQTYAGSSGSDAQCQAVLDAVGAPGAGVIASGLCLDATGCAWNAGDVQRYRCTNMATNAGANEVDMSRACSCNANSNTCSSPAGIAGEVDYNFDDGTMQYCNGANWINMGPKIAGTGGTGFTYTAPTTGLQGHWTLDETSGTTFADSSGNGYTGTAAGGLDATNDSVAGQDGTAIEFDDDDDIDMGDIINLSGQQSHTFSIWVRFNVDPLLYSTQFINNGDIFLWWNGANNFGIGDDVIFFDFNDSGTARGFANATGGPHPWNPAINTWYMVTGVHDTVANETYLYIDGQLVGTRTGITQALTTSANTANIGASGTAGSAVQFDDGRIYDTALTAQEVYSLYRATGGTNLGLVHHWELNETATGPAVDSGSGASNGTMTGGLDAATDSTAGQFGTALTFNGTSDYIDTNTSLDFPNGGVTISGWAKTTNTGGQRILSKYGTGGNQKWLLTDASTDTIECGFHDGTGGVSSIITTATTIADGNWHFYACSVTGSDVTAYYDGVAGPTVGHDGTLLTNGSNWEIGRLSTGGEYWNGDLDDIRIYDRALSAAEIVDLYAQGGTTPSSASITDYVRVFVTSGSYTGDLVTEATTFTGSAPADGIAGADAICQKTASDAGLPGTYKAWISTTNVATVPATRFTDINGTSLEFRLVDGTTVIANDWTDLTDNSLDNPINQDETGAAASAFAWTNTAPNGAGVQGTTASSDTCNEWTSSAAPGARYGNTAVTTIFWTTSISGACTNTEGLYCFQQTAGAGLAGGSCSNPSGPAGEMVYNDANNIMQYCNGSEWVGIR